MIKSQNLKWLRKNQSKLQVDKYRNLNEIQHDSRGKRVVLPATYMGSHRYMYQLYYDGMTICSYVRFLDLFITLTWNPNWPEMQC